MDRVNCIFFYPIFFLTSSGDWIKRSRIKSALAKPQFSNDVKYSFVYLRPVCYVSVLFVTGTLLQLLELILAARVAPQVSNALQNIHEKEHYKNSLTLQQPSDEARPSVTSPKQAQPAGHSGAAAIIECVAAAAREHVWLTNPATMPCPPIRLAMLSVLEVLADWLEHACSAPREGASARGAASGASCSIRSALRTTREANLLEVIEPGAAGRHMPGQSLLVSYVVNAGVEERLASVFFGNSQGDVKLEGGDDMVEEGNGKRAGTNDGDQSARDAKEDSLQFVLGLLSHTDVDVRDAAIKASKKWFGLRSLRRSICGTTKALKAKLQLPETAVLEVWAAGARALVVEIHPPNMRRLLRLLSRAGSWLTSDFSRLPKLEPAHPLWEHLCLLCDDGTGMGTGAGDIHAGALEVLGIIVRLAGGGAIGVGTDNMTTTRLSVDGLGDVDHGAYARLLENAADPEQPLSTRVAAAQSLASSGLLLLDDDWPTAGEGYVAGFVRVWFVLLSLSQDHDERVRICAARACSAAGGEEYPRTASAEISGTSGSTRLPPALNDLQALRQVQAVLARMILLAEKGAGGAAEHVVLALLRAFSTIPGSSLEELLEMASLRVGVEKYRDTDGGVEDLGDMITGADVAGSGRGDCGGDGEEIFGNEDHSQFEEPSLFACVAAPYLCRALMALGASTKGESLPETVAEAIVSVLGNLAEIIEGFVGPFAIAPSLTWFPEVYGGVTATLAIGTAVLQFVATRKDRTQANEPMVGDEDFDADFVRESARITKACLLFDEAGLHRRKGVHPDIERGVARVFGLTQSHYETAPACTSR